MKALFVVAVVVISFCQAVVPQINKDAEVKVQRAVIQKSCLDYLTEGVTKNGFYAIKINGRTLTVYCDFRSEPGMAWTLVMSWSLQNKNLPAFKSRPITANEPVNENNPNLDIYRLTLANTRTLRVLSTHWRATCSFKNINDAETLYRDYVRGKFTEFDIMTYNGQGVCHKVEYVNIRGHSGYHTRARFWQVPNSYTLHIDSSLTGCSYFAGAGSVSSEDNFGYYYTINKNFRCTSHPAATTNWWFGGYS